MNINTIALEIRPVSPDDAADVRAFYESLSTDTLWLRYFVTTPPLDRRDIDWFVNVDHHDHVALVAIATMDGVRCIVGEARSIRFADDPDLAEAAIVVADAWQGKGIGSRLTDALANQATTTGVCKWRVVRLAENIAAARVFERVGDVLSDDLTAGVRETVYRLRDTQSR
jgi:GNAT superfamily N-acetyltransferase